METEKSSLSPCGASLQVAKAYELPSEYIAPGMGVRRYDTVRHWPFSSAPFGSLPLPQWLPLYETAGIIQ